MLELESILKHISLGNALDVATGQGYFIDVMSESCGCFDALVGVDINEQSIKAAADRLNDPRISFTRQCAGSLAFKDNTFDTVSICMSLHHMPDPHKILKEMKRVLKPGGLAVIAEMHCTDPNELQLTHIMWHHLLAEMNQLSGIHHYNTFERDEIAKLVEDSGMNILGIREYSEPEGTCMSKEETDSLAASLDVGLDRLRDRSEYKAMSARVEEVKARIRDIGAQNPTLLLVIGIKE